MRILILGDSFAADWTIKYPYSEGWPNILAKKHCVVNLAQAGVSEYKILKQIEKLPKWYINLFELVIVSHTSTYRVHTKKHPIHADDNIHNHADLIFTDIEHHRKKWRNIFNRPLKAAYNYFLYHFDEQYQEDIYRLIRKQINEKIAGIPSIALNGLNINPELITEKTVVDLRDIIQDNPGLMNHLSPTGNRLVYERILDTIKNI